jgi:hypothetical protein
MAAREIKEGDTVLIMTSDGWKTGVAQVVYRDKHGPIGVVVDGKRYSVGDFKKR